MTAFACLACLAVGFLGGFTFGFRIAAMIKLGVERAQAPQTATLANQALSDLEGIAP
jgi:hypothetical protein